MTVSGYKVYGIMSSSIKGVSYFVHSQYSKWTCDFLIYTTIYSIVYGV